MSDFAERYVKKMMPKREAVLDGILRSALLDQGLRPMQVDDNDAQLLQILTALCAPMRALEIGTYFGYSAIHMARALPPGGRLVTLEADGAIAEIARANFEQAAVAGRIELVVGPASDFLNAAAADSFDFVFIDADKAAYPEYLRLCFPLLRSGGVLIADDAFPDGNFAPESDDGTGSAEVRGINTYNAAVLRSQAMLSAFAGVGHGLMVSYKL